MRICASAPLALLALSAAWGQPAVTYRTPPRCQIWLEGEEYPDHDWVEGAA